MAPILFLLGVIDPKPIPITCRQAAVGDVQHALEFLDAAQVSEAVDALQKALAADPACATAQALLATQEPGPEQAAPHLRVAMQHKNDLPPAERAQIDFFAAQVNGNVGRMRVIAEELVQLAPGDWRAHNQLGSMAMLKRDFPTAVSECKKAIALNPRAVGAYNILGYTYVAEEKFDAAVSTFRDYARVAPADPNAHDSLAEALLNTRHYAESESEFQKALLADSRFSGAWTGIAQGRLLRGDSTGADAAMQKELALDPRAQTRVQVEISDASVLLAEGKADAAWALLDRVAKEAKKEKVQQRFFVDAIQARLQLREGHAQRAGQLAKISYELTTKSDLPSQLKDLLLGGVLIEMVRAEAALGHTDAARAAVEEMAAAAKSAASQAQVFSQLQDARGVALAAAGDKKAAVAAFQQCLAADFQCKYDFLSAQKKFGDDAGAAATQKAFLQTPRRGTEYAYLANKR